MNYSRLERDAKWVLMYIEARKKILSNIVSYKNDAAMLERVSMQKTANYYKGLVVYYENVLVFIEKRLEKYESKND